MGNKPGKLLFGLETEFGFSASDARTDQPDPQLALDALLQICADRVPHLRGLDAHVRMYLANGALLYPDVGHPEYATAECHSPVSVLQSLRAGEKILSEAAAQLDSHEAFELVTLYRTTVDYSAIGTTWGCHESYLSRRQPASYAEQVLPHLVSRIIYTGSGGFNNQERGATFVLSPRVFHLNVPIQAERSGNRAIFSLRNESLAGEGYHRVHLICGEQNCSDLSNYLKIGTTALVLAMADAGVEFGPAEGGVESSLRAIRRFSGDTGCSARPLNDRTASGAIDVQRHYLEAAEMHLGARFMPEWAEDVTSRWRRTLDALESDPQKLAGSLDWPTKLAVYSRYTQEYSKLSWSSLPMWSGVASELSQALASDREPWPRVNSHQAKLLLRMNGEMGRMMKRLTRRLDEHGYNWSDLDAFQHLRDKLCELDVRYGQLYPQGIFLNLEQAGDVSDQIIDTDQVNAAVHQAPDIGRARVRGDWVHRLAPRREKYACSWTRIVGQKRQLDLCDPFVSKAKWKDRQVLQGQSRFDRLRTQFLLNDVAPDVEVPADQGQD